MEMYPKIIRAIEWSKSRIRDLEHELHKERYVLKTLENLEKEIKMEFEEIEEAGKLENVTQIFNPGT